MIEPKRHEQTVINWGNLARSVHSDSVPLPQRKWCSFSLGTGKAPLKWWSCDLLQGNARKSCPDLLFLKFLQLPQIFKVPYWGSVPWTLATTCQVSLFVYMYCVCVHVCICEDLVSKSHCVQSDSVTKSHYVKWAHIYIYVCMCIYIYIYTHTVWASQMTKW